MSTIKSSNEHLTLNADGSSKDIKFQANGVEKASIDSSGNLTVSGNLTSLGIDDNADATAITIDSSEQVGIGQAPTDYQLVVREPNGDKKVLELSTGDSTCRLAFSRAGDPSAYIDMKEDGATGTGGLHFGTGTSNTPTTTLKLTSDGRGLSEFTAKAWCKWAAQGTSSNLTYGHNVSSVSYVTTGHWRINYTNSLTYNYSATMMVSDNGGRNTTFKVGEFEQAYCGVFISNMSQSGTTSAIACFTAFGE